MSTLKKTPGAQYVLSATFQFNIAGSNTDGLTTEDKMLDISSPQVLTAFSAAAPAFDVIPLPYSAQVIGGDLDVIVASNDSGTSTLSVGDSASATRYLGATSLKSIARTALVPTGYIGLGEAIRITLANQNHDATTGKVKLTVLFTIEGRVNENLKTT